ncbi:DUF2812 domain-containing protein [Clostridium sp. CF012]|uniref:DUF2812 domain-containing protein n=1 Tax=Clostridium sp. CF012 TaxID=2843319 RepID=UPI001C0B3E5D|nr:DUF2812 domain-containing protein [Clostridium sp. CF012]MBU3144084.1 DUF2812 domain-containing protein [Clostridium sp. CF012]
MIKFKFFINYDKEEKWLNEMAKKGYELEYMYFGYKFRSIKPENATVRIDYRVFKKKEDFIEYCFLFEDSGWKHIAGSKKSGNQYFKKNDENSQEDIFSDGISRAGKYKRLSDMLMLPSVTSLVLSAIYITGGQLNVKSLLNPKLLYLTPGLWERTGLAFWSDFLLETPFVFIRGSIWLIPLILILSVCLLIKSRILYSKEKKSS